MSFTGVKRDKAGAFPGQRQASPEDEGRRGNGGEENSTAEKWAGPHTQLETTDPSVTSEG